MERVKQQEKEIKSEKGIGTERVGRREGGRCKKGRFKEKETRETGDMTTERR